MDHALIVATNNDLVIGKNNDLPWHIPSDLKFFKMISLLYGNVVMGRKTWESLPKKYLKNRENFVVTSNINIKSKHPIFLINDLDFSLKYSNIPLLIIGGSSVYKQSLPYISTCIITLVDKKVENADSFFMEKIWENNDWKIVFEEKFSDFKRIIIKKNK